MNDSMELRIQQEALRLGYDRCGIIRIGEMDGYADTVKAQMERFPESASSYQGLLRFAEPARIWPAAKSIVVCTRRYGKYRIPELLKGRVAKYYLVDSRHDEKSQEYAARERFGAFLDGLGLKTMTQADFGITALRWAGMKAGIGIVRKNNFFCTSHGSWVYLEAWLIDRELELKSECTLKPCPENCRLCRDACPTGSLCAPYVMNRSSCVSCITTWTGRDLAREPLRSKLGAWIYGCDACQDVCPFNRGQWTEEEEFPGLAELAETLTPEQILAMDYDYLREVMQPKFWYLPKEDVWKWKVNVLNAILNSGDLGRRPAVAAALRDVQPEVREMAEFVLRKLDELE